MEPIERCTAIQLGEYVTHLGHLLQTKKDENKEKYDTLSHSSTDGTCVNIYREISITTSHSGNLYE